VAGNGSTKICGRQEPPLAGYGGGHMAACHHPLNLGLPAAPAEAAAAAGSEAAESLPAVAGGEVPAEEPQ
jgi:hypothetical protein